MKYKTKNSLANKILVSGLLLMLGGCNPPKFRKIDCYQGNTASQTTKMPLSENDQNVLVVLSPHFDDAVLSVGGLLSEFEGPKCIVTFFSTPTTTPQYLTYWDEISGFDKSTDARAARIQENGNATNLLGAGAVNLDYVDKQYQTRSPSDISSLIESITEDIKTIVDSQGKNQITIIGPSYFGEEFTHPDHLVVSKAFMQAVQKVRDVDAPNINTRFYFYEDLPYTHHKFGEGEITLDAMLTDFYGGIHLDKRQLFISPPAFDLKMQGIGLYTSQIKAFDSMGEDVISELTDFGMTRCPQFPLPAKPCEVVYEIK